MEAQLSILAVFDDLRRWESVLTDGTSEIEFLRFAQSQDQNRLQWLTAVQEAQRLQRELDASLQNVAGLETKLYHARRLLETSERTKKSAQVERAALMRKITQASDLLYTENINEATRTKFAFLHDDASGVHHNTANNNTGGDHRQSQQSHNNHQQQYHQTHHNHHQRRSMKHVDVYGNEVNSTGSILSDLSVTHSEDDFLDDMHSGVPGRMRKHQSSFVGDANTSYVGAKRSRLSTDGLQAAPRRSSAVFQSPLPQQQHHHQQQQHIDYIGATDKIVASTRVSIPHGNGPITAESIIEAIPEQRSVTPPRTAIKKRSPVPSTAATAPTLDAFDSMPPTPQQQSRTKLLAPQPPLPPQAQMPQQRQHSFGVRTFLKSDTCLHCQKRIKFGSSALKCRECRICIHADCKAVLQLACVPPSAAGPVTPKGGAIGVIADYAPVVSPMVPGIIVHCVNEIESRGLTEVGIYRVSGSEKDVKALKERFLRGKTVPPLHQLDVHVLCGCVKDFLRNLREPLVPTALWRDFSNASQNACEMTSSRDMYRAIGQMPAANRDTLAFLMQHFLRIARAEMVKMPASNIAKVFGPTIVGYSSAEPDQHAIFTETIIQAGVMEKLLQIPADYWCRFLTVNNNTSSAYSSTAATTTTSTGRYAPLDRMDSDAGQSQYFGTPSVRKTARKNKFYATPPYSTAIKK